MVLEGSEKPSILKRPRKDFETGADTSSASNNGQAKGSDGKQSLVLRLAVAHHLQTPLRKTISARLCLYPLP